MQGFCLQNAYLETKTASRPGQVQRKMHEKLEKITGDSLQKAVTLKNDLAAERNNSQQLGLAYRQPDKTLVDAGD